MKSKNEINQTQVADHPNHRTNPFVRSSLFSEVFLRVDVPTQFRSVWEDDSPDGLEKFKSEILNLIDDLSSEPFERWSERETITNWIIPVMKYLGWHDKCRGEQNPIIEEESFSITESARPKVYRPDLLYVDQPKHKRYIKEERDPIAKLREARNEDTGVKIVLEAKYWDKLEQLRQPKPQIVSNKDLKKEDDVTISLTPDEQILKYIDILQCDFGILTDGKTWRLFHRELSRSDIRRYYEFDLGNLLRTAKWGLTNPDIRERFENGVKYFYYFFSKRALVQQGAEPAFVHQVLQYSRKYCADLEDDLKNRFLLGMTYMCNSLVRAKSAQNIDKSFLRNVAESHLFNLIFLRSCEVRRILPSHTTDYLKISLTEIIETLDKMNFDPLKKDLTDYETRLKVAFGKSFDLDGFDIYLRIMRLYEIVTLGTKRSDSFGFEIEGFKESVFESEELKFASQHKISNRDMLVVLFILNFTEAKYDSRKFQQIPYNYLSPRQLGSIYESFLDFSLEQSKFELYFDGDQWLPTKGKDVSTLPPHLIVSSGSVVFSMDQKKRKDTGAYYTPDEVVQYIVRNAIEKRVKRLSQAELLNFRICDPALGSGHFLTSALNFLTDRMMDDGYAGQELVSREEIARRVLDSCLYGVDINPRAIKLAKMSMWLLTACAGRKLEALDDQFKVSDSLDPEFDWQNVFPLPFESGGFDAVVGNPPYGAAANHDVLSNVFKLTDKRLSNSYAYFMELAPQLVKKGGVVGLIVPNTWLSIDSCERLRKHLFFENTMDQLVMTYQIFKDISAKKIPIVDTVVYLCERKKSKDVYSIKAFELNQSTTIEQRLEQLRLRNWTKETRFSTSEIASNKKFKVYLGEVKSCAAKTFELEAGSSPAFFVRIGTQEYAVGKGNPPLTKAEIKKKPYHSDRKSSRSHMPFVPCGDVQRFQLQWSETYLKWGTNLHCPREKEIYSSPHLLVSRIFDKKAGRLKACFVPGQSDNGEFFVNNTDSFNVYVADRQSEASLLYVLGILNSAYIGNYLQTVNVNLSRAVYPKINTKDLKRIPIAIADVKLRRKLESLVEKICQLYSKVPVNLVACNQIDLEIESLVEEIYKSKGDEESAA